MTTHHTTSDDELQRHEQPPAQPGVEARNVLLLAVWFGLVAGLIEGIVFLLLQKFNWLNRNQLLTDVSVEIVWIAAMFNALLFGAVGLGIAALHRLAQWLPFFTLSVSLFAFLTFPNWLAIVLFGLGIVALRRRVQWLPFFTPSVSLFAFLTFLDWLAIVLYQRVHNYSMIILAAGLASALTRWVRQREDKALRFWQRSLPWLAAAAGLVFIGIESGGWVRERMAIASLPAAPSAAPNVLVIVVDTLRADHLSGYGYARQTSPHLDRLAQEGALFERAFSTSSWTAPSHASLLTGRYPHEHGVEWQTPRALLEGRYPTLSEALKTRGYRTAAFSANTLVFNRPMGFGRGFIRFEDFFHSPSDMAFRTTYGRMFEQLVLRRLGIEDIPARKRATSINRSLLRWVERDREKPFFAFLNYMDVHDPYLPPQPFRSKFSRLPNPGGIINWHVLRDYPPMTPEELQGEIDAYDGAIAYVDDQIGQLLGELRRRGLLDHTVVVITSDHGEAFGEHGLLLHLNSLYREVIHVPLIFWYPERVRAGVRVAQPVSNAALPATVMDLIGADQQTLFPGPSLAQLWEAPQISHDWPPPLAEIAKQPWAPKQYPVCHGWIKSLVSSEWHYIRHETLGGEVYDLKNDVREERNLIGNPTAESAAIAFHLRLQQFFPQLKEPSTKLSP